MQSLKDSFVYGQLMSVSKVLLSDGVIKKYYNPREYHEYHNWNDDPDTEIKFHAKIVSEMIMLWMRFAKEIDCYFENHTDDPKYVSEILSRLNTMSGQLEVLGELQSSQQKYQKAVWSIQEAAAEMNYSVKTLQNKISNWKKEGTKMPWLIDEEGSVSRIRVKEFMDFLKGKKKAGRPVKELE